MPELTSGAFASGATERKSDHGNAELLGVRGTAEALADWVTVSARDFHWRDGLRRNVTLVPSPTGQRRSA